tara:strand:- start:149 stop:364 length:216 start_codon:yes stop_codon:yes gene_type:complete
MNLNFLLLGEYSLFVWPAFIFALLSFCLLFFKTYKNYIKQQEIYFKEFGTESSIKVSEIQKKEILSKRLVF